MAITSIQRDTNNNVSLVRMISTDTMATVASTNYIAKQQANINALNGGTWTWYMSDMVLVSAADGNAFYYFTSSAFATLMIYGETGSGTVNPGTANELAYYAANGSTVSGLATADNGVLITSSLGVPSISQTLPSAVQGNITSLGTITSGIWNGTAVTVPYGGTGNTTFTAYAVICAGTTATSAFQNVTGTGTTGYVLTSNGAGALPTWQANPASGNINSGAFNDIAYYSTNPTGTTLSAITGANSSVLVTSALGVPSLSQTLPSAVQSNITALGTIGTGVWNGTPVTVPYGGTGNTTFTAYSVICAGTTATGTFQNVVGVGTAGYALTSNGAGALPTWQAVGAPFTPAALTEVNDTNVTLTLGGTPSTALLQSVSITAGWSGTLGLARGGLAANLTASNGGIFYSTASAGAILSGTATANQMLLSGANGAPTWSATTMLSTITAGSIVYGGSNDVMAGLMPLQYGVLICNSSSEPVWLANSGTPGYVLTANSGATPSWQASAGSGTVNSGTANQIAYYSGTGTAVSGLTNANSARLGTSSTGVPSMMTANIVTSSSSGNFSTSSATLVNVTNLSVSITTTGRPVMLLIQVDGNTSNGSYILASATGSAEVVFVRGSTQLGEGVPVNSPSGICASLMQIDTPTAGTYTYKVQALSSAGTMSVAYMVLTAIEL